MNSDIPRLRMFAGPNGSGKSTLKTIIRPELLGVYINPDEIEKKIKESDFLDLSSYGVSPTAEEVLGFFHKSLLLQKAQSKGYRTYLYYVATEDPSINIARVHYRVSRGGHSVPKDKIVSRYHRSLDLLSDAVRATHRAYIFDNSADEYLWLAEITNGRTLEMKTNTTPEWFKKSLLDKFHH